jgi:hypothetical protein
MLARRKLCALFFAASATMTPLHALAASAAGEKKKGGGVSYLQFETLTATVFRPDGSRGVLTVEAGVDVPDAALRNFATLSQPRLHAAYVSLLQAYAGGLAPGAPPDADYIARQMQLSTNRVLGRQGARLLIGTILIN